MGALEKLGSVVPMTQMGDNRISMVAMPVERKDFEFVARALSLYAAELRLQSERPGCVGSDALKLDAYRATLLAIRVRNWPSEKKEGL